MATGVGADQHSAAQHWGCARRGLQREHAPTGQHSAQLGEDTVEGDLALVEQDDAAGELLELGHVVAGHDHRHPSLAIELLDERQNAASGEHVQAEGGFVEQQDLGLVEQREREVGAHALAETQLARQGVEDVVEAEQLAHQAEHALVARVGNAPHHSLPLEAGGDGVIPPQLGALAEHDADVAYVADAIAHWIHPKRADAADVRREQP